MSTWNYSNLFVSLLFVQSYCLLCLISNAESFFLCYCWLSFWFLGFISFSDTFPITDYCFCCISLFYNWIFSPNFNSCFWFIFMKNWRKFHYQLMGGKRECICKIRTNHDRVMWNNKIRIMIMMMWMMMNRNYPLNVNPYQFLMRIAPPASINAITSKPASRTHQNHQPRSISKVIIHCCGLWNCLLFPTPGIDFWLHFYL